MRWTRNRSSSFRKRWTSATLSKCREAPTQRSAARNRYERFRGRCWQNLFRRFRTNGSVSKTKRKFYANDIWIFCSIQKCVRCFCAALNSGKSRGNFYSIVGFTKPRHRFWKRRPAVRMHVRLRQGTTRSTFRYHCASPSNYGSKGSSLQDFLKFLKSAASSATKASRASICRITRSWRHTRHTAT